MCLGSTGQSRRRDERKRIEEALGAAATGERKATLPSVAVPFYMGERAARRSTACETR
jgi:hypothetical protein